jgi:hypothetical protein
MGIWKKIARAVLNDYGILGQALADKIDGEGYSEPMPRANPSQVANSPQTAPPNPFAAQAQQKYEHQEIEYQVLVQNGFWRPVQQGLNIGQSVAQTLEALERTYPGTTIRAIDKKTKTLVDVRQT